MGQTFLDTFTEASNTNLENHTPEVGSGWAKLSSITTNTLRVVANEFYVESIAGTAYYEALGTNTVDGATEGYLYIDALGHTNNGFMWRIQSSDGGLTRYQFYINITNRKPTISKFISGVETQIWSGLALSSGEGHFYRVEFTGTTIDVYEDDVLLTSQTDSEIAGTGNIGITSKNNGRVASDLPAPYDVPSRPFVAEDDAVAPSLAISGDLDSPVDVESGNITISSTDAPASPTIINLTDGGAGGTFNPASGQVSSGAPSFITKYTPPSVGDITIQADDAGSVFDPVQQTFRSFLQEGTALATGGMWTWFSDQRAFISGGYAFIGHMTPTDPGVSDLNIARVQLSDLSVTDTQLTADFEDDDHDNPIVIELDNGKLVAFYSLHSDTVGLRYKVSTNVAPDSTAWGSELNTGLGGEANVTYANPFIASDGTVYILQRSRGNPTISMLSNTQAGVESGTGWTRTTIARRATTARFYTKYCQNGADRVDVFTTDYHPNEGQASLYHFYIDFTGGTPTYHKSDGTQIVSGLPMDGSEWTQVQDGTDVDGRCWTWQIRPDGSGNPHCLASRYPTGANAIHGTALDQIDYWGYRWTGTAWEGFKLFDNVGKSLYDGESYYTGGLTFIGSDITRIYVSIAPANTSNNYEIQEWSINWGAQSVSKVRDVTKNSVEQMHCRPYSPPNATSALEVVWWGGTYTSFNDHSTQLFGAAAQSAGGTVYEVSLSVGASLNAVPLAQMVIETSIPVGQETDCANGGNMVLSEVLTSGIAAAYSSSGQITLDKAIEIGFQSAAATNDQVISDETITALANVNVTPASAAAISGALALGIGKSLFASDGGAQIISETLGLSAQMNIISIANINMNADGGVDITLGFDPINDMVLSGALTLPTNLSTEISDLLNHNTDVVIQLSMGFDALGNMTMNDLLALGYDAGLIANQIISGVVAPDKRTFKVNAQQSVVKVCTIDRNTVIED